VLPFVLQWLTARRRGTSIFSIHALPAVAGFVIIACTIGRHLSSVYLGYDWWHLTQPTHLRIDGLFLGVCIAYAHNFHRAWLAALGKHAPLLLAVGATLILPVFIWDRADQPWLCTFGFTSLYLGCGCVLVALLPVRPGSGALGRLCSSVVGRALAFVGFYSYAIYLWHRDLGENLTAWLLGHGFLAGYDGAARWLMGTTVYLALAIASGVVAGRLVELPALAVRERLFPPKASALAEQTDPAAESARPAEVPPG
jgi:peptidoglycan/LPS O-acetylase OafA/YrhL